MCKDKYVEDLTDEEEIEEEEFELDPDDSDFLYDQQVDNELEEKDRLASIRRRAGNS